MTMLQVPQIPSRQSLSKATGSFPSAVRRLFTISSISRKEHSEGISLASISTNSPALSFDFCFQSLRWKFMVLMVCSS